jgi:hypothetical protein
MSSVTPWEPHINLQTTKYGLLDRLCGWWQARTVRKETGTPFDIFLDQVFNNAKYSPERKAAIFNNLTKDLTKEQKTAIEERMFTHVEQNPNHKTVFDKVFPKIVLSFGEVEISKEDIESQLTAPGVKHIFWQAVEAKSKPSQINMKEANESLQSLVLNIVKQRKIPKMTEAQFSKEISRLNQKSKDTLSQYINSVFFSKSPPPEEEGPRPPNHRPPENPPSLPSADQPHPPSHRPPENPPLLPSADQPHPPSHRPPDVGPQLTKRPPPQRQSPVTTPHPQPTPHPKLTPPQKHPRTPPQRPPKPNPHL